LKKGIEGDTSLHGPVGEFRRQVFRFLLLVFAVFLLSARSSEYHRVVGGTSARLHANWLLLQEPLSAQMLLDRLLIEFRSVPLDDPECVLRTLSDTCPEAIAEHLVHDLGLAIYYLQCPFSALGDARAAAIALVLIYLDDLPFAHCNTSIGLRQLMIPD
jgi:hypothetical protein